MENKQTKSSRLQLFLDALSQAPYGGLTNVTCPACGTFIQVDAIGNSRDVYCQTEDCFHLVQRGL